ncbi:uncharacterized protein L969DRAFT_625740 [Mixia osmundae IAM 14324]|uniref:Uncharacterized protein n=1 Tax=Mixia osmundae (strain CBS 9802 / IAM 14324 / JCM 22182 / KY 12970) TaxID=764103 RepID=G7E6N6_MIXOS|nr:uncharacterized protein L969DRAFT_625740 [Mixia osmundae IAM 14324]KEI39124.1 hypothetical protein L969DRAFT_625740 [Mixia osmundae IAM 14324]GAA98496.1 hypothetical protein E5Q_05182 [Mixia osmundae IAM 14324]
MASFGSGAMSGKALPNSPQTFILEIAHCHQNAISLAGFTLDSDTDWTVLPARWPGVKHLAGVRPRLQRNICFDNATKAIRSMSVWRAIVLGYKWQISDTV